MQSQTPGVADANIIKTDNAAAVASMVNPYADRPIALDPILWSLRQGIAASLGRLKTTEGKERSQIKAEARLLCERFEARLDVLSAYLVDEAREALSRRSSFFNRLPRARSRAKGSSSCHRRGSRRTSASRGDPPGSAEGGEPPSKTSSHHDAPPGATTPTRRRRSFVCLVGVSSCLCTEARS